MIALLRDPIDRAHSNWTHLWSAGLEPEGDFLRACDLEEPPGGRGWAPFWRYLDLGRYGESAAASVRRGAARAGARAALPGPARARRPRPSTSIFGFLGVDTGAVPEIPAENVTTQVSDNARNRVIGAALRAGARVGHGRLRPAWTPVERLAVAAPAARAEPAAAAAARPPRGPAAAGGRRRAVAGAGDRRPVRRLADAGHATPAARIAAAGRQDRHRLPEHRRPVRRPGGPPREAGAAPSGGGPDVDNGSSESVARYQRMNARSPEKRRLANGFPGLRNWSLQHLPPGVRAGLLSVAALKQLATSSRHPTPWWTDDQSSRAAVASARTPSSA